MVGVDIAILAEKSTKNRVIQVLSEEPSLSAKQIHNFLKKQFSINSSYQATHKTLQNMLSEKVLSKEQGEYTLNTDWVQNIQKNATLLVEKKYSKQTNTNPENLKEGDSLTVTVKGIPDAGWFLIDKVMNAANPKKQKSLALWKHCYSIVGLETKHYERLKKALSSNNWHLMVERNSEVERMFGETLKTYGAKEILYGIKGCATQLSDKIIHADLIAEINYPRAFRKFWEIQNGLPKKIVEFDIARHLMIMRELQPEITITVTRNAVLANEYRKEYLGGKYD